MEIDGRPVPVFRLTPPISQNSTSGLTADEATPYFIGNKSKQQLT
jgi:hypothetical protein